MVEQPLESDSGLTSSYPSYELCDPEQLFKLSEFDFPHLKNKIRILPTSFGCCEG